MTTTDKSSQMCDGLGLCLKRTYPTPPLMPRNYCDGLGVCMKPLPAPTRPSPTYAPEQAGRLGTVLLIAYGVFLATLVVAIPVVAATR